MQELRAFLIGFIYQLNLFLLVVLCEHIVQGILLVHRAHETMVFSRTSIFALLAVIIATFIWRLAQLLRAQIELCRSNVLA
jgi:hypothetical protein